MTYRRVGQKTYVYVTCCVDLKDVDALNDMTENATETNYTTMLRNCDGLLDWAVDHGYARHYKQGLTLKQDWHVSYHRSKFRGHPCFYLVWSHIEFIWVRKRDDIDFVANRRNEVRKIRERYDRWRSYLSTGVWDNSNGRT